MKYTTEIKQDHETGELYVEISDELLIELGWGYSTELEWLVEGDSIILKEVKKDESSISE